MVKKGIYKHYKGAYYQVEGVARHSESEEQLVVYRPMYGDRALWVRPLSMFVETLSTDKGVFARFSYVGDELPVE
ncbi:hypothetical protein SIN8267_00055 [Sinobacterium norvegicum]|uniref:DUF1653 domain-containing protein n=1 Tax=Sinobacterium norvegicum TaxID=1641715 RepID=A0ABM9A9V0_9GAMM|nr:DUF1653 domain-containing protein [Sinobacterium norvegicum]CAH0989978.1 hypothetical protein SIN8267_00055 [Sinobacterium norvegicum]